MIYQIKTIMWIMLFIFSYFGVIQWQYQEYYWGVLFCSRSNGLRQDKEISPLYGSKMLCHMPPIMHHNNIICVFVPAMWMSHPRLCILCYEFAVGSLDNTDDVFCVIIIIYLLAEAPKNTLHYTVGVNWAWWEILLSVPLILLYLQWRISMLGL